MNSIQKTLSTLLIVILSSGMIAAKGLEPCTASDSAVDLNSQIQSLIAYPSFAQKYNLEGDVKLEFTLDSMGHVKVKSVNSKSEVLAKYVAKTVNGNKVFLEDTNIEKVYKTTIRFRNMKQFGYGC